MAIGSLGGIGALGGNLGPVGGVMAAGGVGGARALGAAGFGGDGHDQGVRVTISQAARQALAADPLARQAGLAQGVLAGLKQAQGTVSSGQTAPLNELGLVLETLLALLNKDAAPNGRNATPAIEAYQSMLALAASH